MPDIRSFFQPAAASTAPAAAPKPRSETQSILKAKGEETADAHRRSTIVARSSRKQSKDGDARQGAAAAGTARPTVTIASFFKKPSAPSLAEPGPPEPLADRDESADTDAVASEAVPADGSAHAADAPAAAAMAAESGGESEVPQEGMEEDDTAAVEEANEARADEGGQEAEDDDEKAGGGDSEQISEYEQMRLDNIKRNEALLAQLGLNGATAQLAERVERKKRPAKRKRPAKAIAPAAPTRRSSRTRSTGAVSYTDEGMMAAAAEAATRAEAAEAAAEAAEEAAAAAEIDYDDSSVVRYTCDAAEDDGSGAAGSAEAEPATGGRIVGFRRRATGGPDGLYDSDLSRTYSMQISRDNRLLAAAGHGGRVSLFGIDSHNAQEDPLLSWKAHKGWVAGVAFVDTADPASPSSQRLLLTASNDKTVVLWDVNKTASGMPKAVTRTDRLHASGIFSLDLAGTSVLTAGKDARSVLSTLRTDSGEISVVRSFEEHRSSVTKCARFRPNTASASGGPTVFADCGNDMCICVLDIRSASASPSVVIEGDASHSAVINSLAWHPTNEHIIASVSFETTRECCAVLCYAMLTAPMPFIAMRLAVTASRWLPLGTIWHAHAD